MHPTMLPPAEGLPPAERPPPAGKLYQQMLMATNIWTTSSSCHFIIDRISKQWYVVDMGSDLCVFPRKLLLGHRECTDYTLYAAMGPSSPQTHFNE